MRNLRPALPSGRPPRLSRRTCVGLTLGLTMAAALGALSACGVDNDEDEPDEADLEPLDAEDDENENEDDENENESDENEKDEQ